MLLAYYSCFGLNFSCNTLNKSLALTPDGAHIGAEVADCTFCPRALQHGPSGRVVAAWGAGQFALYTARTMKSVCFGAAKGFAWSGSPKVFAALEGSGEVKLFFEGQEARALQPTFPCERVFGGRLLAAQAAGFVELFEWERLTRVGRVTVDGLRAVEWTEDGTRCAMVCEGVVEVYVFDERGFFVVLVDKLSSLLLVLC